MFANHKVDIYQPDPTANSSKITICCYFDAYKIFHFVIHFRSKLTLKTEAMSYELSKSLGTKLLFTNDTRLHTVAVGEKGKFRGN